MNSDYIRVGKGVARVIRIVCQCCEQVVVVSSRRRALCDSCQASHKRLASLNGKRRQRATPPQTDRSEP